MSKFTIEVSKDNLTLRKDVGQRMLSLAKDGRGQSFLTYDTPQNRLILTYGIVGVSELQSAKYLIYITECHQVGEILGSAIYQLDDVEALSFHKDSSQHQSQDEKVIKIIKQIFATNCFYFSFDYDLTRSQQSQQKQTTSYEQKYTWNHFLNKFFTILQANEFIVPVISGYVNIQKFFLVGKEFSYALISRRDHRRAGYRFVCRGIDERGNVANYAESEQIIVYFQEGTTQVCSFVQARGSIPLL